MLQLQISQHDAQLGIRLTNSRLHLKITEPLADIAAPAAKLEIHQRMGEIQIDQTGFYNAMGYKSSLDFAIETAHKAEAHLQEVTAEYVREGEQLSHIENKGNSIPRMIASKFLAAPLSDVVMIHTPDPVIHYTPHEPQINVEPQNADIKIKNGTVDVTVEPGVAEVRLLQNPSMKIWFTGKVDIEI